MPYRELYVEARGVMTNESRLYGITTAIAAGTACVCDRTINHRCGACLACDLSVDVLTRSINSLVGVREP